MRNSAIIVAKERLEKTKEKLEKKQKLISIKERKIRLKKIIGMGDLIVKAGLDVLDTDVLFGALLEIAEKKNQKDSISRWGEAGRQWTNDSISKRLIISLKNTASEQQKLALKSKKFRWNSFRQEWYGFGQKSEIELMLGKGNAEIVEIID